MKQRKVSITRVKVPRSRSFEYQLKFFKPSKNFTITSRMINQEVLNIVNRGIIVLLCSPEELMMMTESNNDLKMYPIFFYLMRKNYIKFDRIIPETDDGQCVLYEYSLTFKGLFLYYRIKCDEWTEATDSF